MGQRLLEPSVRTSSDKRESQYEENKVVLRLGLELLRELNLVDSNAAPIGLAGFAVHCAEAFPSNFALTYLLMNGVLDELAKPYDLQNLFLSDLPKLESQQKQARRLLLHVLAALIVPIPIRRKANEPTQRTKFEISDNVVVRSICFDVILPSSFLRKA